MFPPCLRFLEESCTELGCPQTTAKELFHALIVNRLDDFGGATKLSAELRQLLDCTLHNEHRKVILERYLGPLTHLMASESAHNHPTECKLATMTKISQLGWQPKLFLWEDGSERIMAVRLTDPASGDQFEMFYTRDHGHVPFLQRDPKLICNEIDERQIYATIRQKTARSSALQGHEAHVKLFVNTLTGKKICVERISLDASVAHLKLAVEDLESIPYDDQRLIYLGRQLEDSRTLRDYGLRNQDILHLVIRLVGC